MIQPAHTNFPAQQQALSQEDILRRDALELAIDLPEKLMLDSEEHLALSPGDLYAGVTLSTGAIVFAFASASTKVVQLGATKAKVDMDAEEQLELEVHLPKLRLHRDRWRAHFAGPATEMAPKPVVLQSDAGAPAGDRLSSGLVESPLDRVGLPKPFVPADLDITGYREYLPFYGERFFSSMFNAICTNDAAFRAALKLYWEAWRQHPPASLPDDDRVLVLLAGLGRDIEAWRKLRMEGALHGFVKCSDGRLYHPDLAETAIATAKKKRQRYVQTAPGRAKVARNREAAKSGQSWSPDTGSVIDRSGEEEREGEAMEAKGKGRELTNSPTSRSRGTRFTPGALPDDWRAFCSKERPDLDPQRTYASFSDYWVGKAGSGALKSDWAATWRNWVRNQDARRMMRKPGGASPDVDYGRGVGEDGRF